MSKNKTTETSVDVNAFIDNVENEKRRIDSVALVELFKTLSGFEPKMWGPTIIGFGRYHYKYESGHEGEAPLAAFAPRKDALVLYFSSEFENREVLLSQLGKFKSSKACVYAKKLEDLNLPILQEMICNSMAYVQKLYPDQSQ